MKRPALKLALGCGLIGGAFAGCEQAPAPQATPAAGAPAAAPVESGPGCDAAPSNHLASAGEAAPAPPATSDPWASAPAFAPSSELPAPPAWPLGTDELTEAAPPLLSPQPALEPLSTPPLLADIASQTPPPALMIPDAAPLDSSLAAPLPSLELIRADSKPAPALVPATNSPSLLKPLATAAAALKPLEVIPLFNGVDLAGWSVHEGIDGAWRVEEGAITCSQGGGGWLRSDAEYSDFELGFEYRLSPGANTGVGLRFPITGSPTVTGIEVQLIDDEAQKYADLRPDQHSGSLYYQFAPQQRSARPVGQWNSCTVVAKGSQVQVTINGVVVNDVQLDSAEPDGKPHPLSARPPIGHIGFQSHTQPIAFRNISLRDLTTQNPSGLRYVDLATGTGEVATASSRVSVQYTGRFTDGTKFDSSLDHGHPITVSLDSVIEGWKEGIAGMQAGGKRKLIVPASLAYGSEGVKDLVPPNATLVFEVELRGIEH